MATGLLVYKGYGARKAGSPKSRSKTVRLKNSILTVLLEVLWFDSIPGLVHVMSNRFSIAWSWCPADGT